MIWLTLNLTHSPNFNLRFRFWFNWMRNANGMTIRLIRPTHSPQFNTKWNGWFTLNNDKHELFLCNFSYYTVDLIFYRTFPMSLFLCNFSHITMYIQLFLWNFFYATFLYNFFRTTHLYHDFGSLVFSSQFSTPLYQYQVFRKMDVVIELGFPMHVSPLLILALIRNPCESFCLILRILQSASKRWVAYMMSDAAGAKSDFHNPLLTFVFRFPFVYNIVMSFSSFL
jgi:hypothetical protein